MTTAELAFKLAESGYAVFPVKKDKTPYPVDGLKSASTDPWHVREWFEKYGDKALIGIHTGRSGITVLDIDYKTDGKTVIVDGFDALAEQFYDIPETESYTSVSGDGSHYLYAAPKGKNLAPKAAYRGMKGVDRRSGESYVVYTGEIVPDRATLAPAPAWLCDEVSVRSIERFEGDLAQWLRTIEPGEPNALVRRAIEDVEALFAAQGNDLSHSDIVEAQHRAIRLAAEGNPGSDILLDKIEELALNREGVHSRDPEDYVHEFHEALASGISKFGAAIQLRSELPVYSLSIVPSAVPTSLISGAPGDKQVFSDLLRALVASTDDDLLATSILWNSPRTKGISRDWGLQFVNQRVVEARTKPEPVRENPALESKREQKSVAPAPKGTHPFLSDEELDLIRANPTFIDSYQKAAEIAKGFASPKYDIPAAWTALSMSFGTRAYVGSLPVNLWFIQPGHTGTGKSRTQKFLSALLDIVLRDNESYYNVGASSSPAAIHEELLMRDEKPSMVLHDEAATFFSELHHTEWMKSLEHHFSSFYDGGVEPSNKVRLPKELRGKSARTSFCLYMLATPDKLYQLINTDMFDTGFLSRVNWSVAPIPVETDERYRLKINETSSKSLTHPVVFPLAMDLVAARGSQPEEPVMVDGSGAALERLGEAFKAFDSASRGLDRYAVLRGPIVRLSETLMKCSALLALYRGSDAFDLLDALTAIYYASSWYEDLITVVSSTSETEFSRDVNEMEAFIKAEGGSATLTKLNYRFRNMIRKSPRELQDRIDFLVLSGRVNRDTTDGRMIFRLNGEG